MNNEAIIIIIAIPIFGYFVYTYLNKKNKPTEIKDSNNDNIIKLLTKHEDLYKLIEKQAEKVQEDVSKCLEFKFQPIKQVVDNLNKILSNNQLRGHYGEWVAEELLKSSGFIKDKDYEVQKKQTTTGKIPDLTVFLPDKTKINIDVKFPLKSIEEYEAATSPEVCQQHLKEFQKRIKDEIKNIKNRDFISIEENTVDFVILFIPNDKIFGFICDQCHEEYNYAIQEKVIICGPSSFVAILMMIRRANENFKNQKNLHQILKSIREFEDEYSKFKDCIASIGKTVSKLSEDYRILSETRDKKLTTIVDKIKDEDLLLNVENNK